MILILFIHPISALFISGRSRYRVDDNFPNSVGERRTHHREMIRTGYQLATGLALSVKGQT